MNPLSILSFLWSNKSTISAVVVVGLLSWYAWRAHDLGQQRDELATQVEAYQQVVQDMQEWHEATTAALERKSKNDTERSEFKNGAAARNSAGRASGDGPLAPVLRDGLREIQRRQASGKEGS